jgi:predicted amidohydrolase
MSQIVAPDSTVIIRASARGTSMMISDINLKKALNKSINPYNDLFEDRRPEMYQVLGKPGDQ